MFGFIFTSLLIFSSHHLLLSAAGESRPEPPPAPDLLQVDPGASASVVLQCRAPPGHGGREYRLYRVHSLVDSARFETTRPYAEFRLRGHAEGPENIYCCQYENSIMSRYTSPKPPTRTATPLSPPHLSVTPPAELVQPGQVLEFLCRAPPAHAGVRFVLRRRPWKHESGEQVVGQSDDPRFRVGPVGWTDGGVYTCLYQSALTDGPQDSAPSSPVSINITVELPAPRLSPGAEGTLVCTGSPSYPGAHFTLFHQGSGSTLEERRAPLTQHSAQFSVPGQLRRGGRYECRYSVLLGEEWAHSEHSAPIVLTDDTPPNRGGGVPDLPLVVGSISAALLFLLVLVILGVGVHRYAEAAAEKKRRREQDRFWHQVHSRDHIIDLTLQRVGVTPKGIMVEPVYDHPLTTFTQPTCSY